MHYYTFNIGNYRRRTTYLSIIEHGIYRMLIDTYYLQEGPLSLDKDNLMRTHCIRSADEVQAFENVLKDFFIEKEDGFFHKECSENITKFKGKSDKASAAARTRWENNADAMRTHSEGNANHKPITNNHKPIKEGNSRFTPPTLKDVKQYCDERSNSVNPENFLDHYQANGWMRGKAKIKDWKACVRTWEKPTSSKTTTDPLAGAI